MIASTGLTFVWLVEWGNCVLDTTLLSRSFTFVLSHTRLKTNIDAYPERVLKSNALTKTNTAGFHTTLFCDGFTNMSCWWKWCLKVLTWDNTHSSSSPCGHPYTSNAMYQHRPFNFSRIKTCWWVCLHKADNLHLYSSSGCVYLKSCLLE